jgi:hypothetical protein
VWADVTRLRIFEAISATNANYAAIRGAGN